MWPNTPNAEFWERYADNRLEEDIADNYIMRLVPNLHSLTLSFADNYESASAQRTYLLRDDLSEEGKIAAEKFTRLLQCQVYPVPAVRGPGVCGARGRGYAGDVSRPHSIRPAVASLPGLPGPQRPTPRR